MEIYTIINPKQAFRQNYTEERRVGDYAAAKYLYSCLLARLAVECYAQRRQLPLHDTDFHKGLLTHVRGGHPGQAYAAIVHINNSIRFVLDNANDIFEAGMRKSFRRVRFANHILRQKHFARCGQQLAREFGRHHPIATPIRLKVFYGSSGFTTPAVPLLKGITLSSILTWLTRIAPPSSALTATPPTSEFVRVMTSTFTHIV
ncbi:hypothetical protein J8273_7129 [Carpediemonas membranifera]|uniref:Uncharacterized protein n=1 Tax=Carpediemonas membranifera TaxID=201153 RepID=A0A8J6E7M3_9EUKA|nr:hypothetical protein J8273_7129 [Carpediemonas membranifera]|eukprot:KAG9390865.1 hypothetical protein J8273_7129 [Carpediemonas membranifera]